MTDGHSDGQNGENGQMDEAAEAAASEPDSKPSGSVLATAFFMGLNIQTKPRPGEVQEGRRQVDLSQPVADFNAHVKEWDKCAASMEIEVKYVRRKDLPPEVLDGGKEPERKRKAPAEPEPEKQTKILDAEEYQDPTADLIAREAMKTGVPGTPVSVSSESANLLEADVETTKLDDSAMCDALAMKSSSDILDGVNSADQFVDYLYVWEYGKSLSLKIRNAVENDAPVSIPIETTSCTITEKKWAIRGLFEIRADYR